MCHVSGRQASITRRSGEVAAALMLMALAWSASLGAQAQLEYQVKASYLYNFIEFTEWPADTLGQSTRFNLCVVDLARFGPALEPLLGEQVQGRPLTVVELKRPGDARTASCHVLFVARGYVAEALPVERGMLTVGETPGFLARGGIINLVEVRGRIRFEVNQAAAERVGLTLDSRLLRLALNVP